MKQNLHTHSNSQYENLLAGNIEMPTSTETIKKGAPYHRGQVLGYLQAENKCVAVDKKAADSSKSVYAVLAEDIDATDGDVIAAVYYAGEFNSKSVIFVDDNTVADHKLSARQVGIFFK